MQLPHPGDYIDIHVHDGTPSPGIFILESLMAHEGKSPADASGVALHLWHSSVVSDGSQS